MYYLSSIDYFDTQTISYHGKMLFNMSSNCYCMKEEVLNVYSNFTQLNVYFLAVMFLRRTLAQAKSFRIKEKQLLVIRPYDNHFGICITQQVILCLGIKYSL